MVQNLNKLIQTLNKMEKDIKRNAQKGMEKGADSIVSAAKSLAPVDDGELVSSISANTKKGSVEIIATAPHAQYVEMGTFKMPPQPFLFPAFKQNEKEIVQAIASAVRGGFRGR